MTRLFLIFCLFLSAPLLAQDEEIDELRRNPKAEEKIKAAQAAYITERLGLTPQEAEKFWPIYREFNQKRQGLRQQFQNAKKDGRDEKALLDLEFKLKQEQLDLEKDYAQRFQQVISPQKLMNLRQAEGDFRKLIIRQLQERQQQAERVQRQRDRSQQRLQQRNN